MKVAVEAKISTVVVEDGAADYWQHTGGEQLAGRAMSGKST